MNMLIMGAPGSGKGTQTTSLVKRLNIPAISTGEMMREAISKGNETGVIAAKYINNGMLVPDDIMIDIVLERLNADDCRNGYILDGFPRTLEQAQAMDNAGINVDVAVFMDVSDEVVLKRLSGRRVCNRCGATYHITSLPSAKGDVCQFCSTPLTIRADDKPETVKKRLGVYKRQTGPVIDYYAQKGLLLTVDADGDVEKISDYIISAISRFQI
ncbi:MAG: adenylate kinase [Firmicutes bacterium]|nr:adenylate kinase [Bacillota bacterium]